MKQCSVKALRSIQLVAVVLVRLYVAGQWTLGGSASQHESELAALTLSCRCDTLVRSMERSPLHLKDS
jgi:hypothetical protein